MTKRNRTLRPKPGASRPTLTLTHPNAAGIDIGSAAHFVAVPPDRDDEPVREFPSLTADLSALPTGSMPVAWTLSPGIHWCVLMPLFELLEARGFTVLLVNARHVRTFGTQVRCAGLPMAAATHDLRAIGWRIPAR